MRLLTVQCMGGWKDTTYTFKHAQYGTGSIVPFAFICFSLCYYLYMLRIDLKR
jgi:hypothetical protein